MKKAENNITELVFILDRSGSMSGLVGDTIGGFNSLIKKQEKQPGECFVSTVLFDNESTVLHDRVELSQVRKMTREDYVPWRLNRADRRHRRRNSPHCKYS